jgi:hypothetical protein
VKKAEPEDVHFRQIPTVIEDIDGNQEIHFRYNREERLARAPVRVRQFYEKPTKKKRFGFFTSLVDTRPKAMLFISIVVICAIILVRTYLL